MLTERRRGILRDNPPPLPVESELKDAPRARGTLSIVEMRRPSTIELVELMEELWHYRLHQDPFYKGSCGMVGLEETFISRPANEWVPQAMRRYEVVYAFKQILLAPFEAVAEALGRHKGVSRDRLRTTVEVYHSTEYEGGIEGAEVVLWDRETRKVLVYRAFDEPWQTVFPDREGLGKWLSELYEEAVSNLE